MTKTFSAYNSIRRNINTMFVSEEYCRVTIETWLQTEFPHIQDSRKNKFGGFEGRFVARPGVVQLWTGLAQPNLYSKTIANEEEFLRLGMRVLISGDKRTKAATALGMYRYRSMSSTLRLYSPRCVLFLLLTTRSAQGQSFRNFIADNGPSQAYWAPKLIQNIRQVINGQPNTPRIQSSNPSSLGESSPPTPIPGCEISSTSSQPRARRNSDSLRCRSRQRRYLP